MRPNWRPPMTHWRVYVIHPEVARGVKLKIPTSEALARGDTLAYEFPNNDRAAGTVIIAVPTETVITRGPERLVVHNEARLAA
jgi:hypothetical protein